jgi:tryptophan-rich sensory protein
MNPAVPTRAKRSPLLHGLIAATPVFLAGAVGNIATIPNIPTWYANLARPPMNPPNWVFGPVWSILYLLMAIAFFRILRLDPATPGRARAIGVFMLQLALNTSWSFAFFGAHRPALGLMVILPLESLIVLTIFLFRRLDRIAAGCLLPYAAWVAFATYLNIGFWMLN